MLSAICYPLSETAVEISMFNETVRDLFAKMQRSWFRIIFIFPAIKNIPMKKFTPELIFIFLLLALSSLSATFSLDVVVYGFPSSAAEFNATGYSINLMVVEYGACGSDPSIIVAIIDSSTCSPATTCNKNWGQANIFTDSNGDCIYDVNTTYTCRPRPEKYFIFRAYDPASMRAMAHLLDSVGSGHFILAYSMFPVSYSILDTSFMNAFQQLGSAAIPLIADGLPFIFFCKKGDPGSVMETVGATSSSMITLSTTFDCSATGVNEVEDINAFTIFPNPANDQLNIGLKNNRDAGMRMYDALGKLVMEKNNLTEQESISITDFSSGLYYLTVISGNSSASAKLSIVR
jgi:hypothetical protein